MRDEELTIYQRKKNLSEQHEVKIFAKIDSKNEKY